MGILTLRPSGTVSASGASLSGGATSYDGGTADNNPATGYTQSGGAAVVLDIADAAYANFPTGSQVRSITPRVTHNNQGAWNYFALSTVARGSYGFELMDTNPSVHTQTFQTRTADVAGGPWVLSSINELRVITQGANSAAATMSVAEIYLDLYYNEPPTGTAQGPTGTVTTTSSPVLSHGYSDPENDAQERVQWKVFSAAQYGAAGFDPNISGATFDSGIMYSSSVSYQLPVNLSDGVTYRAYVYVGDVGSGTRLTGGASFVTFTISTDPPAVPDITSLMADLVGQGYVLSIQGRDNMLTQNQADAETDTTGVAANANCTVVRSTAQAVHGLASFLMTASGAGDMSMRTVPSSILQSVGASTQYTAFCLIRPGSTVRSVRCKALTYDGAGNIIQTSTGSSVTEVGGNWTFVSVTFTTPASGSPFSVAVVPEVIGAASGELHYVDKLQLAPGSGTTWTRGGLLTAQRIEVQRSVDSGSTWAAVSVLTQSGSWMTLSTSDISDTTQAVTAEDFFVKRGVATVQYRARSVAVVNGLSLASAWSSPVSVPSALPVNGWIIKDRTNPALSMSLTPEGGDLDTRSVQAAERINTLGASYPVMLTGPAMSEDYQLTLYFSSKAEADKWEVLRGRPGPLFIQTPTREAWVTIAGDRSRKRPSFGSWRRTIAPITEVAPPV